VFDQQSSGSHSIRIRAIDSGGLFVEKILMVTVDNGGYLTWATSLPMGERAPTDDPGGHGIVNLLRYAFGMDALNPERERLPQIGQQTFTVGGETETYLTLTYTRRTEDPSLIYLVEASDDLLDWNLIQGTEYTVSEGDGMETVTIVDSESMDVTDRRFLRVRVER
jgi:hypothetical protein